MGAQPATKQTETVVVNKHDLGEAWGILERVVVSLRKIGSHHATPSEGAKLTPEQYQKMSAAMHEFFDADFFRDASRARRALDKYISDDEGEAISDSLKFWEPKA